MIAVYVAFTRVPDVFVQLLACVMLIALPQLSLEGACAYRKIGRETHKKRAKKMCKQNLDLIAWIWLVLGYQITTRKSTKQ